MRSAKPKRRSSVASAGLVATLAAVVCCASCGSSDSGNSPFGGGSSGGSGGNGADGSGTCVGFGCSTVGGDGGGPGFGEGGVPPVMDGGTVGGLPAGSIDQCTGKLTPAIVTALQKGGPPGSMKWLYPYDKTVFPGGILGPVLQWSQSGTPADLYVHMKSTRFEYKGCFAVTSPQFPLPQAVWTSAFTYSNGPGDPVTVELTTSSGGTVSGPLPEQWTFALGSLKGAVYYNTYTSQLTNPPDGAVMKIAPGAAQPTLLLTVPGGMASPIPVGPCISCHSLSADGSMIVAQRHAYPGGLNAPGSMSFSLAGGVTVTPTSTPTATTMNDDWGFSAVYPNGSRLLTAGEPSDSTVSPAFPCGAGDNPGMIGPKANVMYDTKTGTTLTPTGLAVQHAMMPMWSPDGKKIVYNDTDNHQGHSLMVQDYDYTKNAFSNPVSIYNDSNGKYAGWPFFTPDSSKVVFVLENTPNFSTIPPASFSGVGPVQASAADVAQGDLYIVSVATPGPAQVLDVANGYRNGASYLPYPGRDEHLQFYPTVMPVASGGYFWVFFTSRRNYGNTIVGNVWDAPSKKIWVAAINIAPPPGADPSHPAFVLPGQELSSGNIRAFPTLNPCKGDNNACDTGVDCCGQSCYMNKCGAPPGCSATDSKCTKASDCCDTTEQCIAGFCAKVVTTIN
jgi:hypothetical protein